MKAGRLFLLLLLALSGSAAGAQTIVSSAGPDRVAVTLYRDPRRGSGPMAAGWLNGYALVSETRRVTIPAGTSELRFEGVAGGIIPQSAIVTGLPEGVVERNRDAYLLSPATLLDASLGQRVAIRRTSRATGRVTEGEAVIRSGAAGAVVLQTAAGVEALRCTGLPETPVYAAIPPGLAARPTLSVRARSARLVTATVTLSYVANGFDWQAHYIAELAEDGRHLSLFAWLTLGSSDETGFREAEIMAVGGQPNREEAEIQPREGGPLTLACWPQATTSDIPLEELQRMALGRGARMDEGTLGGQEIVVTGTRIRRPSMMSVSPITVVNASLEALGDLKLYRIPEPMTLAARSQKQVAFLTRPRVEIDFEWRSGVPHWQEAGPLDTRLVLKTRNETGRGLGIPLPAGALSLFRRVGGRTLLVGETGLSDRAVGERVELEFAGPPSLHAEVEDLRRRGERWGWRLTVRNSGTAAVDYESRFGNPERGRPRFSRRVRRVDGLWVWRTRIPAGGTATLDWRWRNGKSDEDDD